MKASLLAVTIGFAMLAAAPVGAQSQSGEGLLQNQEREGLQHPNQSAPSAQPQQTMRTTRMDTATVRQIQQSLKAQGHDVTVDGQWGPESQAALREYQRKQGMQPTGSPDAQTLASLGIESETMATTERSGSSLPNAGGPDTMQMPPTQQDQRSSGASEPQGQQTPR